MLNIQISAFSHRLFCGLIIGQRHVLAYLHRAPGVERNGSPEVLYSVHRLHTDMSARLLFLYSHFQTSRTWTLFISRFIVGAGAGQCYNIFQISK